MMKAALLSIAILLTGCATHTKEQLAAVRAAGVSPRTVAKLEKRGVLAPEDLIELRRRSVGDDVALRQLGDVGVDYVVQRDEMRALRAAKVSPAVASALARESDRFVAERYAPLWHWEYDWAYDHFPRAIFVHHTHCRR